MLQDENNQAGSKAINALNAVFNWSFEDVFVNL